MSNHEKSNTFTLYKDEIEHARKLLDKNASVNTSRTTAERYANTGINALPHVSDPIFHVADTRHHRNSAKAGKQLDHLLKSKYKQTETPITSNIAPLEEYRNSPEERINSKNIDPKFRERNVLIPQKQKRSRSVTSGANHNMYINKNKNESLPSDQPTMVPVPCPCPSSDHTEKCKKNNHECESSHKTSESSECECEPLCQYCYFWDGYWPFMGGPGIEPPSLEYEVDYVTFNGLLIQKWRANVPTPQVMTFSCKDIFKFTLCNDVCLFDFNFKFENIPGPCQDPTILNVNPQSTQYPLQLNQFLLIEDPNIVVISTPPIQTTDILAAVTYYNSNEAYYNQLLASTDTFETTKNIIMSTQLFFVHINQIKEYVRLSISHNTCCGENIFKVCIKTNNKIEIKETLIPVDQDPSNPNTNDILILQRTIYIEGRYFMTYAVYVCNIKGAIALGTTETIDQRQIPLQLGTMILFGATLPVPNLNTVVPVTDHQRQYINLFQDVILQNP